MDTDLDAAAPADRTAGSARLMPILTVLQKGLGHELPNHLIAVEGLARLLALEEGDRLGADGRDYLRRLTAAAEKAHALVATLAEVARLSRPTEPIEAVDFAEVAAEAIALTKQLAADRPAEYHGPVRTALLAGPRNALRKAFVLLLRRAAATGTDERPARIDLSLRATATEAEICLRDDGEAVAREESERLFEPFAGGDGHGLDLFLVRHLAEAWGGAVRIEARPDRGTAILLTCPLAV
jgi:signal transduction histidine kinase